MSQADIAARTLMQLMHVKPTLRKKNKRAQLEATCFARLAKRSLAQIKPDRETLTDARP